MPNTLKLDTSGFDRLIKQFESIGGDVKPVVEKALKQVGNKIGTDTLSAITKPNLPAGGKYSSGQTENSVIRNPSVVWEGDTTAYIPVGFVIAKPGAGGFLISGTPKMKPDKELNRMYKGKKYMNEIQKEMSDVVLSAIVEQMQKG